MQRAAASPSMARGGMPSVTSREHEAIPVDLNSSLRGPASSPPSWKWTFNNTTNNSNSKSLEAPSPTSASQSLTSSISYPAPSAYGPMGTTGFESSPFGAPPLTPLSMNAIAGGRPLLDPAASSFAQSLGPEAVDPRKGDAAVLGKILELCEQNQRILLRIQQGQSPADVPPARTAQERETSSSTSASATDASTTSNNTNLNEGTKVGTLKPGDTLLSLTRKLTQNMEERAHVQGSLIMLDQQLIEAIEQAMSRPSVSNTAASTTMTQSPPSSASSSPALANPPTFYTASFDEPSPFASGSNTNCGDPFLIPSASSSSSSHPAVPLQSAAGDDSHLSAVTAVIADIDKALAEEHKLQKRAADLRGRLLALSRTAKPRPIATGTSGVFSAVHIPIPATVPIPASVSGSHLRPADRNAEPTHLNLESVLTGMQLATPAVAPATSASTGTSATAIAAPPRSRSVQSASDIVPVQIAESEKRDKLPGSRILSQGDKKPSAEFTQLSEMFPTFEDRVVQSVLVTSGNNLEAAIDQLLSLPPRSSSQPQQPQQQQQPKQQQPSQQQERQPQQSVIAFDEQPTATARSNATPDNEDAARYAPTPGSPSQTLAVDYQGGRFLRRGASKETLGGGDEEEEEAALAASNDFGLYNADDQGTMSIESVPVASKRKLNWGDIKREEIKGQPTKLTFAHGAFGTTYEAQLVDSQGSKIAVKIVQPLAGINIDRLFEEFVRTYKTLSHPNVLAPLSIHAERKQHDGELVLLTELMPRGSVSQLLHGRNAKELLPLKQRVRFARDAALGMNYLHQCRPSIFHYDLNSYNLLVDSSLNVKVTDFNMLGKVTKGNEGYVMMDFLVYCAPEVLLAYVKQEKRGEPLINLGSIDGEKADVYSFGVVLWEMMVAVKPYDKEQPQSPEELYEEVAVKGHLPPLPRNCPPDIANLLSQCWHPEPRRRPTFQQIIASHILDLQILSATISKANIAARLFWKEAFFKEQCLEAVDWDIFAVHLSRFFQKNLRPDCLELKLLKMLIADNENTVTLEWFAKICEWFGPFVADESFMKNVIEIVSIPGFFGNISRSEAEQLLLSKSKGYYLIRYSGESAGFFTVTCLEKDEHIKHYRIKHKPGFEYMLGKTLHKKLSDVIKAYSKDLYWRVPMPGSKFVALLKAHGARPVSQSSACGYSAFELDD